MGTVGDAYDNAMAESFFATLQCELLDRRVFKSKAEARTALFTYIEGWYNPRRRHGSIGYLAPTNSSGAKPGSRQAVCSPWRGIRRPLREHESTMRRSGKRLGASSSLKPSGETG